MFDYLNYRNTFPVELFSVGKIPSLNPFSAAYKEFWKKEKRKCIEGHWVEHEGQWRWMTGPCYFYINFWHILANPKGGKSKTKSKARPTLRDLEWIKTYVHSVARGFSGFEGNEDISCHRALQVPESLGDLEQHIQDSLKTPSGIWKSYVPALEYLYQYQDKQYGKPLYYNDAQNVVDVESRGGGKSYTSSCFCAHNFLFDGAMDYDEWLQKVKDRQPLSSETLIGGIDTKYTKDLIKKVRFGLENLEGGFTTGGTNYAPPLSKKHDGNWESGGTITQSYKVKNGGRWEEKGTRSKIQHRTFKDNAFAANGTRASFNVLDEVGFFYNLAEALGQMAECTANGAEKFGTIWMCGTGGDMDGGSTEALKAVFYDPRANQCLVFDDIFEGTGKEIGFFIPAWMTLNQFKDELGNTDKDRALTFLMNVREEKQAAKSKAPLHDELQQRPIFPSEAFLLSEGNVFPAAEIKAHLGWVEASTDGDVKGQQGELLVDSTGTMSWVPYLDKKNRQIDYPAKKEDDLDGCIIIWEHPEDTPSYGLYIGGCDPVDQEHSNNSASLGSMFVMKRATPGSGNSDKLVAEYSGHPQSAKEFHENCRKLIAYYNGVLLYENNLPGLKAHFERQYSLKYLAYTPTVLKANATTSVSRTYGQHMTVPVKDELELATRDWLMESAGDGKLNLHQIYSVPLLKELLAYNESGNFDRVMALLFAVCQKMQMHFIVVKKKEEKKKDNFWSRAFSGGNNW